MTHLIGCCQQQARQQHKNKNLLAAISGGKPLTIKFIPAFSLIFNTTQFKRMFLSKRPEPIFVGDLQNRL